MTALKTAKLQNFGASNLSCRQTKCLWSATLMPLRGCATYWDGTSATQPVVRAHCMRQTRLVVPALALVTLDHASTSLAVAVAVLLMRKLCYCLLPYDCSQVRPDQLWNQFVRSRILCTVYRHKG